MTKKHAPMKDRRNIGQVVFPIEKMIAARDVSSSCVGVEAALETDTGFVALVHRLSKRARSRSDT